MDMSMGSRNRKRGSLTKVDGCKNMGDSVDNRKIVFFGFGFSRNIEPG
jgi:hypothetical protein